MAFGKKAPREEPVPAVPWRNVREFTLGGVERPVTPKRKRAVRGARAIRVPKGGTGYRVLAPCAYCAPPSVPAPPGVEGPRLYEDEEGRRLLCFLDTSEETGTGGVRCHRVRDGDGEVIGTILRVPPARRPFKHTWRVEQPGHPEIVGRNQWATGDMKEIAGRGTGRFVMELVDSVASLGVERDATAKKVRTLEWRAGEQVVMVSQGNTFTVRADWFDRRLAFAFALLGDR